MLITGASAGIGAELARQLAARGHNVVLVARREQRLRALAEQLRLMHGVHADVEPCDLADADARRALVGRLLSGEREVTGVCNNAGFGTVSTLLEADLEREQEVVRVNVEAVHHLTGAFLPRMVERGEGAILNVASTAAFQPLPGLRDLRREQGVRPVVLRGRPRRAGRHRRVGHVAVPGLHPHRVRRSRRRASRRSGRCPSSCSRRRRRWPAAGSRR